MNRASLSIVIALAAFATSRLAALDTNLTHYTWSSSRAAFTALEEQSRDASKRMEVETTMIAVLGDATSTPEAKEYACRILRVIGTDASVPAVAPLLTDEKLSHYARFALQGNTSSAAGDALRAALEKVSGPLKVGMINSLGVRRDEKSVALIAPFASDANADTATAAMDALGRIASKDAAKALQAAKPADALLRNKNNSLVECADRLANEGDKSTAKEIFAGLADNGSSPLLKLSGVRGLTKVSPDEGAKKVLDLLSGSDADLQAGAAQLVGELPSASDAEAAAMKISSLPPALQAAVITGLSRRTDKAGAKEISAMLASNDATVKQAAIEAIGIVGSAGDVPALLKIAAGSDDFGKAAVAALGVLHGTEVSKEIAKATAAGLPAAQRAQAAEILGARQAKSEVETLITLLDDKEDSVRAAAAKSLRSIAGAKEIKPLVARLAATTDAASANRLQQILMGAADRSGDTSSIAKELMPALKGTDAAKEAVLPIFARVGGSAALAAVREQINAGGPLHKDAVRALADWRNDDALEPLIEVAKADKDDSAKILALRGYIRIVADKKERNVKDAAALIGKALDAASRDEERTAALGGLGAVSGVEPVKIAATYLDKPALAAAAANAIAQSAKDLNPKMGKQIEAQLKKAREATTDANVQKQLDALIKKFAK